MLPRARAVAPAAAASDLYKQRRTGCDPASCHLPVPRLHRSAGKPGTADLTAGKLVCHGAACWGSCMSSVPNAGAALSAADRMCCMSCGPSLETLSFPGGLRLSRHALAMLGTHGCTFSTGGRSSPNPSAIRLLLLQTGECGASPHEGDSWTWIASIAVFWHLQGSVQGSVQRCASPPVKASKR